MGKKHETTYNEKSTFGKQQVGVYARRDGDGSCFITLDFEADGLETVISTRNVADLERVSATIKEAIETMRGGDANDN